MSYAAGTGKPAPGAFVPWPSRLHGLMRMHRFTEPTPTSRARADVIEIFVSGWEIECCAPPPVVGESGSWTLEFIHAARQFPNPELDRDRNWLVAPWQSGQRQRSLSQLTHGGVTAFWSEVNQAPPAPGTGSLRGYLSGTVHGIAPADFPSTTGIVHRIRLVTQHYTRADGGDWVPVPGTITMSELQRSPRWFTDHPRQPPTDGTPWIVQTGVLLDVAVLREPADPEH